MSSGNSQPIVAVVAEHRVLRRALQEWAKVTLPQCDCRGMESLTDASCDTPDVILFDADVNERVEAIFRLRAWAPHATLIALSVEDEPPQAVQMLERFAWVAKPQLHRLLSAAILSAVTPGGNHT